MDDFYLKRRISMNDSISLIVHSNPKSPVSEAYRMLRTNIQFSGSDRPIKVVLLTSSGPSEGKTTTVCNLAVTFAQSGSRVLIIDADLRKPKVHQVFGVENKIGLTNILVKHEDYKNIALKLPVDNLELIPSGPIPPNPSELLSSNVMKNFINAVREDYDMVIIDSPPIIMVTDAAVLSAITDGTILVAASGKVQINAMKNAKELLERVNANILGVVLNKIQPQNQDSGYYYYYYYDENEVRGKKKWRKLKGN